MIAALGGTGEKARYGKLGRWRCISCVQVGVQREKRTSGQYVALVGDNTANY